MSAVLTAASRETPEPLPHEPYALHWANDFTVPALLITFDLRLIWANAQGHRLLLENGEMFLSGNTLGFAEKSQAAELRSVLEGLDGSPVAWIYGTSTESCGLIRAERLAPEGRPPAAALLVFRRGRQQPYYWGDIDKLFGLTKAEVTIVKRIVDGESAKVIADATGVSLETVRTHIRRIYNKLGVVGREELIATVAAFRTI